MQIPDKMLAIAMKEPGGPEVLTPVETATPAPPKGHILVKVSHAGVNRPDVLQRQGLYPAPPDASELLGLEVAGEVVALGTDTSKFKIGDKVCALVHGGGYAEYCIAEEGSTLLIPSNLTEADAAGLPETVFTVWHNLFQRGQLKAGETALIHGGSSGIGSTAIQLANAIGAKVLTTVGSEEKAEFTKNLGATLPINYRNEDFVEAVKQHTSGRGVDVILDMVGGDYIKKNIKCAAEDGRIVSIAFLNGSIAEINFAHIMMKRLTVTGSTLRARTSSVKAGIAEEVEKHVWPLIENNKFRPVIDSTFPLKDAAEAHKKMESSSHMGKIILKV